MAMLIALEIENSAAIVSEVILHGNGNSPVLTPTDQKALPVRGWATWLVLSKQGSSFHGTQSTEHAPHILYIHPKVTL